MRAIRAALVAVAVLATLSAARPAGAADAVAQPSGSVPQVGAVYFPSLFGIGPALGLPHVCTGGVVHSPGRDLVLTAAHCITGTGLGYEFAPGYLNGATPYGVWTVTAVYVDRAWASRYDTQHDYAFLRLAPKRVDGRIVHIEDVTGAAALGAAPAPGTTVTVVGYTTGSNDAPLTCTVPTYIESGYPAFDCVGFTGGTSGSPWLTGTPADRHVVGVIGGLHQGGCTSATSYSSAFGADVVLDWQRAADGAPPDFVPPPPGDGCWP